MDGNTRAFVQRVLLGSAVAGAVLAAFFVLAQAALIFLLIFASILFALFLRALSDPLSARTPLSPGWALTTVVLLLAALVTLGARWLAPEVAVQLDQLASQLPQAIEKLGERAAEYQWIQRLLEQLPAARDVPTPGLVARLAGFASLTVAWLASFVILVILGLYLAAQPALYFDGLVRLFPSPRRPRIRQVGLVLAHTLRLWLLGRLILMLFVAVLTALGLVMLDMPLALTLGLIAGVLDFIPNIGPIIAAVPAVLIGLAQDPLTGVYVVALFVAVQSLEGYVLTPLVLQRTADIPPAVTIVAQVLLGSLLGFLGLFLAAPIAIVVIVLVKELYVRDVLGDRARP